jgi:hypothetical protein
MGPHNELLKAAQGIGFSLPSNSSSSQHVQGLTQAQQAVEHSRQAHELELRLSALSAHLAFRTVTDQSQLSARAAVLSNDASTLQLISASKDAIADQLRSASLRPSVPVAPEYQQDFANMLRSAASNAAVLQDGLQVLQWAACLSDKPSCWEDQLRVIRDSAQAVKDYLTAMQDFDQQLTQSSNAAGGSSHASVAAADVTGGN